MPQNTIRRNSQEELIAMKKEILDRCITKQILCKEGAKLLKMHPKSFLRLKRHYLEKGEQILMPRKPGPKSGTPPNKTPEWIEDIVVKLAFKYRGLGPEPLNEELFNQYGIRLNQSTIYRILKGRKVRYYRDYPKIEREKPKLYCLDSPGLELQMDGCYPYGRARKLVAFSAIDDCSRYVWGKCFDKETANNAIKFVTELVKRVPFKIQAIRVDNRYGKVFKAYCENILNIEVIQNDPYTPKQNGKIERYHKTLKYKFFWAYCGYSDSIETLNYKYHLWLDYYNYQRRHGGYKMNRMTPVQKIASTMLYSTSTTYRGSS